MELRSYPLPYLSYRLSAAQLEYAGKVVTAVRAEQPDLNQWQVPGIQQRALGCVAFADMYGKTDQFAKLDIKDHLWGASHEFWSGSAKFKVMISKANEKYESTGFQATVTMPVRVFDRNRGETHYVVAVLHMPYVHFIGWIPHMEMEIFRKDKTIQVKAGNLHIKSMADLCIEKDRQKGRFL